jgi:hypothetical protein
MSLLTPHSLIRPTKRLLVFTSELGVLVVGIVLSIAISFCIATSNRCENSIECPRASFALICGVSLTVVGFVLWRRKTRPWKIQYDAAGFALMNAERTLHPVRARYSRLARLILVWLPTVLAAFVLFFLPVASHLVHPSSQYFKHFRIPIPWTTFMTFASPGDASDFGWVTVIASSRGRGRLGITPFRIAPVWREERLSIMTLTVTPKSSMPGTRVNADLAATFTCEQFRFGPSAPWLFRLLGSGSVWEARCQARQPVYQQDLYADFVGCEEDLAIFYRIVRGIRPVE